MADVGHREAGRALKRWQQEHGFNPMDDAHINAYKLARQASKRPTPEKVWNIVKSAQLSQKTETKLTTDFYLVPKGNFPHGLPQALIPFLIQESSLRKEFQVPVDTNLQAVYIIDKAVKRESLGLKVKNVHFSHSLATTTRTDAAHGELQAGARAAITGSEPGQADAAPGAAAAAPGALAAAPEAVAAAPGGAAEAPGTAAVATAGIAPATTTAPSARAPREASPADMPTKRQRVMRIMASDENQDGAGVEEAEAASLEKVIKRIKAMGVKEISINKKSIF